MAGTGAIVGLALQPAPAQSQHLTSLTLTRASELLRGKVVSAVDLTKACFDRIAAYDPTLNAFITVTAESALAVARQLTRSGGEGTGGAPFTEMSTPHRGSANTKIVGDPGFWSTQKLDGLPDAAAIYCFPPVE